MVDSGGAAEARELRVPGDPVGRVVRERVMDRARAQADEPLCRVRALRRIEGPSLGEIGGRPGSTEEVRRGVDHFLQVYELPEEGHRLVESLGRSALPQLDLGLERAPTAAHVDRGRVALRGSLGPRPGVGESPSAYVEIGPRQLHRMVCEHGLVLGEGVDQLRGT